MKKTEICKEKARKPFEFYTEEEGSDNAVLQKEQVGGYKQNSPNWICRHFLQNYQVCFLFLDSPKALNFNEVTPMAKCKIIMKERWILNSTLALLFIFLIIFAIFTRRHLQLWLKKFFNYFSQFMLIILLYFDLIVIISNIPFISKIQFCK